MIHKHTMLEADMISRRYRCAGKGQVYAVNNLSLKIHTGECHGIVGESGCGKSTLMRMLAGMETPSSGQSLYKGEPVALQMKRKRNEIQMIFQNSMNAVNQYATAEEIIGEPLRNFTHMNKVERRQQTAALIKQVGLSAADLLKYPAQFSGGQLQRICIARALAAEPKILLLDEPLSSLDVSVQAQIMKLLEMLGRENGLTQVLVSHDLEAIYYLSDSLSVMYGGWIVEDIEHIDMFSTLCHPYTKRLFKACGAKYSEYIPEKSGYGGTVGGCPYEELCPDCVDVCRSRTPEMKEIQEGHWVRCHKVG